MANKITKKDRFNRLLSLVGKSNISDKADLTEFLAHEIELLEKKSSSAKPTAKQTENLALVERIFDILAEEGKLMSVTDIARAMDNEHTTQKVSAMVKKLVDGGRVDKIVDKKQALFRVTASAEVEG